MKERVVKSLISLFALLANYEKDTNFIILQNLVEIYLSSKFSRRTKNRFLVQFEEAYKEINDLSQKEKDRYSYILNEINAHCYIVNRELSLKEKIILFVYLLEFMPYLGHDSWNGEKRQKEIIDLYKNIGASLSLPLETIEDCMYFLEDNLVELANKRRILIYTGQENLSIGQIQVIHKEGLNGNIIILTFPEEGVYLFKVDGECVFEINNQMLYKRMIYTLNEGAAIVVDNDIYIYQSDLVRNIYLDAKAERIELVIENLHFQYPNSEYGIKKLDLSLKSGQLMGIMGPSGAGKTTLLNILNGTLKPNEGQVLINNINIHQDNKQLKKYIGYVPQDDALIEELSVWDNLLLNAKLCFKDIEEARLITIVTNTLKELELYKIKDLKIGKPVEKIISGGQRKRLNIALELIRNPLVILLDEPTSGLSSADSENVLNLLKQLTYKGRIIIVNIHQPSSKIFKQLDRLTYIDQMGYPIYFGETLKALPYFKHALNLTDEHISECQNCGNINPEELFRLVEDKSKDENINGDLERAKTPEKWHRYFLRTRTPKEEEVSLAKSEPVSSTKKTLNSQTPNLLTQFRIYLYRDLIIKISNKQFLYISIAITPILAVLLAMFCKQIDANTNTYSYALNENIPIFMLMSVVVSLFIGLISSAEEIVKDRKLLNRESFLDLSRTAYIFSKTVNLFAFSFVQILLYVVISNYILEIPNVNTLFFFVLWSTACFSNILGLLISSLFTTRAAVYILIPFLLIPQILLAGAVLEYDKMNPHISSPKNVPLIGNLMVSRWAYEAMAVKLFKDNDYEKLFFDVDLELSYWVYYQNLYIPKYQEYLYTQELNDTTIIKDDWLIMGYQTLAIISQHSQEDVNSLTKNKIENLLSDCRGYFSNKMDSITMLKDEIIEGFEGNALEELKTKNRNKQLSTLALKDGQSNQIIKGEDNYIRKFRPIYDEPVSNLGNAHYFAPYKKVADIKIPTPIFNVLTIWFFTFLMMIICIRIVRKI